MFEIDVMPGEYPRLLVDRDVTVSKTAGESCQLEPDGLMIAVQGARRDTYPSGMARDMGGGMQVYVMRAGRRARREDLVETLDNASADQLATVDEQRAFAEAWRDDPSKQ
jgi:hypothetical protein